jgi:hypothetical protein
MCGAPKSQTITQKTELDPNLQRLLYGGIFPGAPAAHSSCSANVRQWRWCSDDRDSNDGSNMGGSSSGYTSFRDMFDGGGPGMAGTEFGGALGGISNAVGLSPVEAEFGMYAMGGMVAPQMGIASLNQGQMPLMGGQLPNLSDPMVAATLAAAALRPQMQYGMPMGFRRGRLCRGPRHWDQRLDRCGDHAEWAPRSRSAAL